ncbi:hypothetical protein DsansV1_C20g0163571 [Dioscorea sansibarensis]
MLQRRVLHSNYNHTLLSYSFEPKPSTLECISIFQIIHFLFNPSNTYIRPTKSSKTHSF